MNAIYASVVGGAGAKRAKVIGATTGAVALVAAAGAVAAVEAAVGAAVGAAAAKARNGRTLPGILRGRNPPPRTLMPRKSVTSVNRLGT